MLRVVLFSRPLPFYPLVGVSPCGWRRSLCFQVFRTVQTTNPGNAYKYGRNCTEVLIVSAEDSNKISHSGHLMFFTNLL